MSCGGNCKCKKGSVKAQDEYVKSEINVQQTQLDMQQYDLDTSRMAMLFDVLAREIDSERTGGTIWGVAEKELKKIIDG